MLKCIGWLGDLVTLTTWNNVEGQTIGGANHRLNTPNNPILISRLLYPHPLQLCAQHGSDMYTHYLRRLVVVASPILQSLTSQSQSLSQPPPPPGLQGKQQTTGLAAFAYLGDRPLKQGLQVPQSGAGVLAWRLLESEARRVCRDGSLGECCGHSQLGRRRKPWSWGGFFFPRILTFIPHPHS
jgi:hypothetical protein